MLDAETINRIVALGHSATIQNDGDKPFVVVPEGMSHHDLSAYYPPKFISRTVNLADGASMIEYVNRFKTKNTLLFAAITDTSARLTAYLDYHGPTAEAARCAHVAHYSTVETQEWKTWMSANREQMRQVEFAGWLEDNEKLFVEPSGAELLELVLNLEGKQDVRFISSHRLDNGKNKLDYEEDVDLKGGATSTRPGSVELPKLLVAGISPFHGAPPYKVRARFKYSIQSRALSLWFETIAPHLIIRDSVKAVVDEIKEKTELTPLLGNT